MLARLFAAVPTVTILGVIIPARVFANTPTTYAGLIEMIIDFINVLIPGMFAILFVILVWRTIDAWILHAGDPAKREEGRRMAITAVIVLAIAVSIWGIIRIIKASFFTYTL